MQIGGCWSPSATSRRPRPRSTTTPRWTDQPWRRDSNETASGKPGAVQSAPCDALTVAVVVLASAGDLLLNHAVRVSTLTTVRHGHRGISRSGIVGVVDWLLILILLIRLLIRTLLIGILLVSSVAGKPQSYRYQQRSSVSERAPTSLCLQDKMFERPTTIGRTDFAGEPSEAPIPAVQYLQRHGNGVQRLCEPRRLVARVGLWCAIRRRKG